MSVDNGFGLTGAWEPPHSATATEDQFPGVLQQVAGKLTARAARTSVRAKRKVRTTLISTEVRAEDLPASRNPVAREGSIIETLRENVKRVPAAVGSFAWAVIGEFTGTSNANTFSRNLGLEFGTYGFEFAVRRVENPGGDETFKLYARYSPPKAKAAK